MTFLIGATCPIFIKHNFFNEHAIITDVNFCWYPSELFTGGRHRAAWVIVYSKKHCLSLRWVTYWAVEFTLNCPSMATQGSSSGWDHATQGNNAGPKGRKCLLMLQVEMVYCSKTKPISNRKEIRKIQSTQKMKNILK